MLLPFANIIHIRMLESRNHQLRGIRLGRNFIEKSFTHNPSSQKFRIIEYEKLLILLRETY